MAFQQLRQLAFTLKRFGFQEEFELILKLAAEPIYLYSYVPTKDLDLVLEYGLASSEYIKNTPELLEKIFPEEKDREEWLQRFEEDEVTLKGPSVWMSKPNLEEILKLDPEHPLSEDEFTLIKIDYDQLKKDQPDLKIYGLELVPYQDDEYEERQADIEHELSEQEIQELANLSFEETWSDYLAGGGYYSPNVPHGVVLNAEGVIPPEYLSVET